MTNTSATGGILLPAPAPNPQPLEDAELVTLFQQMIVGLVGAPDPSMIRPRWQPNPPNRPGITDTWAAVGISEREADYYPWVQHNDGQSAAVLLGGGLTVAQQYMSNWITITSGGFGIAINGGSVIQITGLNFSTATNLYNIAGIMQTACQVAGLGVFVEWNGYNFTFSAYGATASISYLTTPTDNTQTDISGQLLCTASTGASIVSGTVSFDQIRRHENLRVLISFYGPSADTWAALTRDGLSIGQNRDMLTAANMALVHVGEAITLPDNVNNLFYYRVDMPVHIRREIVRNYPVFSILSVTGTISTADVTVNFS